jgi:hypothetical protein
VKRRKSGAVDNEHESDQLAAGQKRDGACHTT